MLASKRTRTKERDNMTRISEEFDENDCPNVVKRKRFSRDGGVLGENKLVLEELEKNNTDDDGSGNESSDSSLEPMPTEDSPLKQKSIQPVNNKQHLTTPDNKYALSSSFLRKRNGTENCHFDKLSDELLLIIFLKLPKVQLCKLALVSKRWRRIAYDDSMWSRIDLGHKSLHPRNLEHVLKRGVRVLRLAGAAIPSPVIKPKSSYLIPNFVSKLEYLDLTMAQISAEGVADIMRVCRNLKKLSLENCPLNLETCEQIGHNTDLEVLNLTSTTGIKSNGLEAILACCTKLITLNISWTAMDQETLQTLSVTICKSVKELNISGCRKNLTDDHVKFILEKCPGLIQLDMSDCTSLTFKTLDNIVKNLKHLKDLGLSRCYNMSSSNFKSLTCIKSLTNLQIHGVLHDAVLKILIADLKKANIVVNNCPFSTIGRPTVGCRKTSIWGEKVRE
ncbi:S-phase kinase-associated protein 2 [Cloeon dipterum]|uniref:S-phase kinase-associated protein 2 n=1 Tax=Cloeon dipterum TaxID=197152 RepID=UPI00322004A6